jgi:hypothetical protein
MKKPNWQSDSKLVIVFSWYPLIILEALGIYTVNTNMNLHYYKDLRLILFINFFWIGVLV